MKNKFLTIVWPSAFHNISLGASLSRCFVRFVFNEYHITDVSPWCNSNSRIYILQTLQNMTLLNNLQTTTNYNI